MTFLAKTKTPIKVMQPLYEMLRSMRPDGSRTEGEFIDKWIMPLGGIKQDDFGNLYKWIGQKPLAMWSAHTDTVHRQGGYQLIKAEGGKIKLDARSKSNCLGADNTAGVWLLIEMIKAKQPGLYVFHRGEERGGLGSRWAAKNIIKATWEGVQMCIAFDRRNTDSIITFQRGTRCCSDVFAKALGAKLGDNFKTDEFGTFTDTASYVDIIPECTNVSVGFSCEHSSNETLDLVHVAKLREKLIEIDVSDLPIVRKPGDNESRYKSYSYSGGGSYGGHGHWHGREEYEDYMNALAPDEYDIGGQNYCPDRYNGYYMRGGVMINCAMKDWSDRKKEVDALKKARDDKKAAEKGAAANTNNVKQLAHHQKKDDENLAQFIRDHAEAIAALFTDWGWAKGSKDDMLDLLEPYLATKTEASKTKQ